MPTDSDSDITDNSDSNQTKITKKTNKRTTVLETDKENNQIISSKSEKDILEDRLKEVLLIFDLTALIKKLFRTKTK